MTTVGGAGRAAGGDVAGRITNSSPGNATPKIDLRRRGVRQACPESLLRHASWLEPDERALLRAVYHENVKVQEIATVSGLSPSAVRARLRRIFTRINDPCFAFVLNARDTWPPPMRRIATACFLHGWTLRRAAAETNMSIAAVRRYRDAVIALCEANPPASDQRTEAVA